MENNAKFCNHLRLQSMWSTNFQCTIDDSIKGAASLRRYGITFDGNIDIKYMTLPVTYVFFMEIVCQRNDDQSILC